jgi:hypothetical protein
MVLMKEISLIDARNLGHFGRILSRVKVFARQPRAQPTALNHTHNRATLETFIHIGHRNDNHQLLSQHAP